MTRKATFFEGWSWFKFNNLGLALGMTLKFYTSVTKGLKLKVRKFLGLSPTFVEFTGKKLLGGGPCFASCIMRKFQNFVIDERNSVFSLFLPIELKYGGNLEC